MQKPSLETAAGNALLMALATILILSAVGANVLANLSTRYNVSHTQVRGWKQAQHAAEAAGDIAYAAVRHSLGVTNPADKFPGWTKDGNTYTSPVTTFGEANLRASATVDPFYTDADGNPWYRIRATGTVPLRGLKRVGMDDRMGPETRGDSLLRKIDFNYDHFVTAYGPKGDGVGIPAAPVPVSSPQLTRRIELVAAPITPFEAAIKAVGTYYGLGSAGQIDSFDSSKGPYVFAATSPTHARYADARSGHVQIGSKSATVMGTLYGNLATNGGVVIRSDYITGTIDNNVPFTLPPMPMPAMPLPQHAPTVIVNTTEITPPAAGTPAAPVYYMVEAYVGSATLSVKPYVKDGVAQQTYVAIRVKGDIGSSSGSGPTIIVPPNVRLQVFFEGNFQTKAENIINTSGFAGNLQIYGITPPDPNIVQRVDLNSGGGSNAGFSAVFYTPSANFTINGAPDITGAIVCKNFYGNGNAKWHYDLQLRELGRATDYRVASYVEDTR
jgi:hypothetical protein